MSLSYVRIVSVRKKCFIHILGHLKDIYRYSSLKSGVIMNYAWLNMIYHEIRKKDNSREQLMDDWKVYNDVQFGIMTN